MEFAARLRLAMNKREMRASVLSYKTGIDRSYISKYLQGIYVPKHDKVQLLAKALHVSEAWLGGYDTSMEESDSTLKSIQIPVYGEVAAGIPLEAITNIEDYEEIPGELARTGEFAALKIKGDSMEPRMMEGDVVIVRIQNTIENGEIAVVMVNGDAATCKKIKKTPEGVMLVPINPSHEPMFYSNKEIEQLPVRIFGKVVELRAKFR